MIFLGIGGLHNAVSVKREMWPGLAEEEYGITQGHDSAAAIVVNGEIVAAAAEERFSRAKHTGELPVGAIRYCLREANVTAEDVDEIAHSFDYQRLAGAFQRTPHGRELYRRVFGRQALVEAIEARAPELLAGRARLLCLEHHLCHAASAFFTSGWEESLVLVVDWMGEAESLTVWHGKGTQLKKLHTTSASHSLGMLYALVTLHLGFAYEDAYKVMGLAPYGDPKRFTKAFEEIVTLKADGALAIPILGLARTSRERETHEPVRAALVDLLGPMRSPDGAIEQEHKDIAAGLQECLSRALHHVCQHWQHRTALERLSMAGGVALNCAATGVLRRSGMFQDIFVQPAAGDDGAPLGAALYCASVHGELARKRMPVPYLGPSYDSSAVVDALELRSPTIDVHELASDEATFEEAARRLADGQVLAWFHGRMEFGPRALGNRSILADARRHDMRDRVNNAVKKRESFRPFAPATTLDAAHEMFAVPKDASYPYMIETVLVKDGCAADMPATTHVDGSARLQTVSREDNPRLYGLLKALGAITGLPVVLNTSFNVNGQPIVNTPLEAVDTLLSTDIDVLFLDNYVVTPRKRRHHSDPRS